MNTHCFICGEKFKTEINFCCDVCANWTSDVRMLADGTIIETTPNAVLIRGYAFQFYDTAKESNWFYAKLISYGETLTPLFNSRSELLYWLDDNWLSNVIIEVPEPEPAALSVNDTTMNREAFDNYMKGTE